MFIRPSILSVSNTSMHGNVAILNLQLCVSDKQIDIFVNSASYFRDIFNLINM